ncbi:MAG: nucleotidyl transferase AbiEii/AbiGii toxin family protein [Candidatus Omnitrophota bacterium]
MHILTNFQKEIIKQLSLTVIKDTFFLTGGTALSAFYLKHRYSEDLDFFTEVPGVVSNVFPQLEAVGKKIPISIEVKRTFNTFTEIVITSNKTKERVLLHFAQDSPYRLKPAIFNKEYGISVDNLLDISCNKFSALFDRHDMKDFVDIYFIDREKIKFEKLYLSAKKKHLGMDDYWLSQALRYINDLTILPRMIKPIALKELQGFFNSKIKSLMAGL